MQCGRSKYSRTQREHINIDITLYPVILYLERGIVADSGRAALTAAGAYTKSRGRAGCGSVDWDDDTESALSAAKEAADAA